MPVAVRVSRLGFNVTVRDRGGIQGGSRCTVGCVAFEPRAFIREP